LILNSTSTTTALVIGLGVRDTIVNIFVGLTIMDFEELKLD